MLTMTSLIAAGAVTEDDDAFMMIQGLSRAQAEGIANWLVVATKGPVTVRYMSPLEGVNEDIVRRPEDIQWQTMDESSAPPV